MPETLNHESGAESVTVRIPVQIDPAVTPNGRGHWRKKHRLQQELKEAAYYAAYNANLEMWEPEPPLTLNYLIALGKGRRRMDDTNAIASMKYLEDGIAAALGIDDKHFRFGRIQQERDPEGIGYIEVAIEHVARPAGAEGQG